MKTQEQIELELNKVNEAIEKFDKVKMSIIINPFTGLKENSAEFVKRMKGIKHTLE